MTNATLEAPALDTPVSEEIAAVAPGAPGEPTSMYTERKLFSTRSAPWMKLGTQIDEPVDAATAAKLGGLDFDVELHPVGFTTNKGKNYKRVPDRFAITHGGTGEFFQFASSGYGVVQYREAFTFLDAISPHIVAAGALRGGRVGFMVVKHPDVAGLADLTLAGVPDPHDMYVVVRTSQDMSYALEISLMALRGRCMNELTLPSFTKRAPQRWSLRHSKSVHTRMLQAQDALTKARNYQDEFAKIAARLADIDVNLDDAKNMLELSLPDRPRRDKQIEEILGVYEQSPNNGFVGSGWGLVQGVSEYFEWERPGRAQTDATQFQNALEGTTHQRVGKVAQVVLSHAS